MESVRVQNGSPVALVTGGAKGIGRACCEGLTAAGFRVVIHYRESEAQALELAERLPNSVCIRADLRSLPDIDRLVDFVGKSFGALDVLINNAGTKRVGMMPRLSAEDYREVADLTTGTWYLTKLVLWRFMLRRRSGRIVQISSIAARMGSAGSSPYAMAKGGLDALTKTLAQELAGTNILVNSISAGFVETDMIADMDEASRREWKKRIPLRRFAVPQEIAEVAVFLSTAGSYVHGAVLPVDGGIT
jgi:3-oxoacyl-[acyl-carrier protein] reductase